MPSASDRDVMSTPAIAAKLDMVCRTTPGALLAWRSGLDPHGWRRQRLVGQSLPVIQ
jgi:hypothetical protein